MLDHTLLQRHSLIVCQAGGRSGARPKKKKAKAPVSEAELLRKQKKYCYGCGSVLQCTDPNGAGHLAPEKYELKKMHRQLNQVLCDRCSELSNGAMIPGVQDLWTRVQLQQQQEQQQQQQQQPHLLQQDEAIELLGKALVTPEQLRQQLMEVRSKKAVVVMVVDLTDASGTLMGKVRDMVGPNPIILVGTKMDLLPGKAHPRDVAEWLMDAAVRKKLNVISCHLVSSRTGEGVSAATSKVCAERKGRDVYVVGAANVGKSAFVRAMLKDMSLFDGGNFDPAARATGRYLPVESPMPGTTLGIIPLQAFVSGGTLYDTPGVHLHHRVPHMLTPEQLRLLHPRKRLAPILPPTPKELAASEAPELAESGKGGPAPLASGTYFWGDLVRMDVVAAPSSTWLAFYSPSTLRVRGQPLAKASAPLIQLPSGSRSDVNTTATATTASTTSTTSTSSSSSNISSSDGDRTPAGRRSAADSRALWCADSVAARGGLVPHPIVVKVDGGRGPLADIAVSGVPGWVTVFAPGARRDIRVCVWAPRGVEVFLRPAMPAGPPPQPAGQGGEQEDSDLEDGELSEQALAALAAEYGGGGENDPFNDPAWWEAAVAELQGFESSMMGAGLGGFEGGLEEEEEEAEEGDASVRGKDGLSAIQEAQGWVTLSTDRNRKGRTSSPKGLGVGGRRVVSGSVEDALRRPRLDAAFGEWAAEDEDNEEDWRQTPPTNRTRRGRSGVGSHEAFEGAEEEGVEDMEEEEEEEVPERRRRLARASGKAVSARRGLRGSSRISRR